MGLWFSRVKRARRKNRPRIAPLATFRLHPPWRIGRELFLRERVFTGGEGNGRGGSPPHAHIGSRDVSAGIRDVILPGDMKELKNKVTEAKKAAEANLIVRREETATMRSQANTAKVLEGNPTLMRLREMEVLEKIAGGGKLNVILGEKGLAERVVNLL
jgi:hypothetical protein